MADVYGNTTKNLTTNAETILYTCPLTDITDTNVGTAENVVTYAQVPIVQTQVCSIIISALTTDTYSIYLTDLAATLPSDTTPHHYALFNVVPITAPATDILATGLVMTPGQTLWVEAATADVLTVTISYIETS